MDRSHGGMMGHSPPRFNRRAWAGVRRGRLGRVQSREFTLLDPAVTILVEQDEAFDRKRRICRKCVSRPKHCAEPQSAYPDPASGE